MAYDIKLPKLHNGQAKVWDGHRRFTVVRCGRRWGKTKFGMRQLCLPALHGHPVAWFAPSYQYLDDPWGEVSRWLAPIIASSNKQEKRIRLINGGVIDFWSLENEDAGRSRKYKFVVVDEAGLVPNLIGIWYAAIRPTLTDLKGDALFLGTPKGRRGFQEMFAKGEAGDSEWASFPGLTRDNPYIDPKEVDEAEAAYRKMGLYHVFQQEYEGIPADDGGNPFGIAAIAKCVAPLSGSKPVAFGIDLAKSQDWTWVVGLDDEWRVCVSERWQSDWGQTRRRIRDLIGPVPACIDSTGVGDPIVEELQRDGCNVEAFKFTSQSKQQIMEGLASKIQQEGIRFPDGTLRSELESFEFEYVKSGVRYSAPVGLHDDGVCALALAVRSREVLVRNRFDFRIIEL